MHRLNLGKEGGKNISVKGMSTCKGPEEGEYRGLEGSGVVGAGKEGAWWWVRLEIWARVRPYRALQAMRRSFVHILREMGSLKGFLEGEIKSITFEFRNNDFGYN